MAEPARNGTNSRPPGDYVLLHFFLLFTTCYVLGVAILFLSAEFCRQQNHAFRNLTINSTTSTPLKQHKLHDQAAAGLDSHNEIRRNKTLSHVNGVIPLIGRRYPIRQDVSQGIGFYYRHFVFDYHNTTDINLYQSLLLIKNSSII
jgi:hypothetical protein